MAARWWPFNPSDEENEAYQYSDLSAKHRVFRLIKILPPRESALPLASPTLRIEICEATVGGITPYNTLSYTWGSYVSAPDRRVIVETADGPKEILIFPSLELALLELSKSRLATSLPIFVDQICINQNDNDEKASQVQLMGAIYAQCRHVVVWLGPGTKRSNEYFDYIDAVCREGVLTRFLGPRRTAFAAIFDAVMDTSIPVQGTDKEDRDDILALLRVHGSRFPLDGALDVLQRTWFTRLWIIQEACLGQNVTFVCGARSLCMDCFRAGMLFYTLYNTHFVGTVASPVPKDEVRRRTLILDLNRNVIRIIQERRAIHTLGQKQAFHDLVLKYNVNEEQPKIGASLPEDRLFGFLGIARDDYVLGQVRVHYGNAGDTYTQAAGALLGENPDIVCFSQEPKRLVGLPSWVPDWSMDLRIPRGYIELTSPAFAAGGSRDGHRCQIDVGDRSVTLSGVVVDEITRVGERVMQTNRTGVVVEDIDYPSAAHFFDEIDEFLDAASSIESSLLHGVQEAARLQVKIRLSDFGLTERSFAQTMTEQEATNLVTALHEQTGRWGRKLIDVERVAEAHSFRRFLSLIDFQHSSHWAPPSETDTLTLCAVDPPAAAAALSSGICGCLLDILDAARASVHLNAVIWYLQVRRRFAGVAFRAPQDRVEIARRVGIDPEFFAGPLSKQYHDNLMRNAGQKLYLTRSGYVGTGPLNAKPGDTVAVFLGGTVPHVVRRGALGWRYLGETYCEGVMDGEVLRRPGIRKVDFRLL